MMKNKKVKEELDKYPDNLYVLVKLDFGFLVQHLNIENIKQSNVHGNAIEITVKGNEKWLKEYHND